MQIIFFKGPLPGKITKKCLPRAEEVGMSKNAEIVGLGELKPDPQNLRKHTPRNVAMIVDALQEVGAARSIVIDEKGVSLAGNSTIKAAGRAGLARVKVVDADGSEIIAVKITYGMACIGEWLELLTGDYNSHLI
jgi:hypothetical protein